jgi:AcrR family transcriptional regulator
MASGTNLASIGYHYGSKEALLNEALMQATGEWGQELYQVIAAEAELHADPLVRFESIWTKIVGMFGKHRQSWAANFEIFAQIDHVPTVREAQVTGLGQARNVFGHMFGGADPTEAQVNAVGSFYQALIIGVMAQWLIDPEHAPSGADLAEALRVIIDEVTKD